MVLGDPVGGIRKHVHALLFGLDPGRFRILYFYPPDRLDKKGRADTEALARKPNVILVPLGRVAKRPHPSDLANLVRISGTARRYGCALFHGHGAKGGVYARLAGLLNGGRAVYTPHGGVVHAQFGVVEHRIYWTIERALRRLTDVYVFESDYSRSVMTRRMSLGPGESSLVPNGVSPVFGSPRPGMAQRPRVAVIGVMRHEKGQDLALRTARLLRDRGVVIDLVFAGDGPMRPKLGALARDLGIADCVSFLGDLEDTTPVMDAADIVLIPSRFEAFGYVALEALLRRRPVIAAKVGGLCETVLDGVTGLLVADASAERFAAALFAMIDGTWRFDAAAPAIGHHLARFHEQTMIASLAQLYGMLLNATPRSGDKRGPRSKRNVVSESGRRADAISAGTGSIQDGANRLAQDKEIPL